MSERKFLRAVIDDILTGSDLFWHHCTKPWLCEGTPGLPDLIVLGQHGLMAPELKSDRGRSSRQQQHWGRRLGQVDNLCSCECERRGRLWGLYRPGDLESGKVAEELSWLR